MLDLFSGIGGISLAAHWAGMETVAFCEIEPFCQTVLKKHWPDIPIYDDVKSLTKERLDADGIGTIDIICGGYPCQPFSQAGKRQGANDDRHLWPEVKRLLQEIRPRWFIGENVIGHVTLGLDEVLDDLESLGYSAQPFDIPACAVGADHERRRIFIPAYANGERLQGGQITRSSSKGRTWTKKQLPRLHAANPWPEIPASEFSRKDYGISRRLDEARLKALGNAVVPQQIYPILKAIKLIDEGA